MNPLKVLPWVVDGAGGLGAGKTSGAGTRGVSLDVVIGGRTGYSNTNDAFPWGAGHGTLR